VQSSLGAGFTNQSTSAAVSISPRSALSSESTSAPTEAPASAPVPVRASANAEVGSIGESDQSLSIPQARGKAQLSPREPPVAGAGADLVVS
jgi:hypothetical protein